MGIFGGSKSKTSNTNIDNRSIVDYSNAEIDASTSVDSSINGTYAGNSGNITVTDGGAFDVVESANFTMADTAQQAINSNSAVTQTALNYGESLFADATGVLDNAGERMLDSALAVHDSALSQIDMGNDLALSLASINADQTENNNDALASGFKSMMQFVEGYSRSDGSALAETNMKTVGIIAVAAVAAFYLMNR